MTEPASPHLPESRLPYPGLRAFRREETDLFFGRESTVAAMVRKLAESRFLAVLGSSGSGKSSLVRTGLFDALEIGLMASAGTRWRIIETRPGAAPIAHLAEALLRNTPAAAPAEQDLLAAFLARGPRGLIEWATDGHLQPNENLLVFVDQFEELFRFDSWARREEAEAFVGLLIEASREATLPIHVVITMRSEYLGAAALLRGLAEALNAGQFLTPRLTRAQCEEAIRGPADVCGITIRPDLVARLLNDLEGFAPWEDQRQGADPAGQLDRLARQADQLPLLQHALNWLCERARQRGGPVVLTLGDYDTIGGLAGALDQHANEVLRQVERALGPRAGLAARVFRSLVSGKTVADAVRRPTRMDEMARLAGGDLAAVEAVVQAFRASGCNFLLPDERFPLTPQSWVDISHESLIRQWRRFSEWVEAEAEDTRFWTRLVEQATDSAAGRAGLLAGRDLRRAVEWKAKAKPSAAWAARLGPPEQYAEVVGYLARSRSAARTRMAAGAGAMALLLGGAGLLWADRQAREAALAFERNRALQEERDRLANAGELFGVTLAGERQRNGDWDGAGRLLAGLLPAGVPQDPALLASLQEPLIAQYAFGGHDERGAARSLGFGLAQDIGQPAPSNLSFGVPEQASALGSRYARHQVLCGAEGCTLTDTVTGAAARLTAPEPAAGSRTPFPVQWAAPDGSAAAWITGSPATLRHWSATLGTRPLPALAQDGRDIGLADAMIADAEGRYVAVLRRGEQLDWAGPEGSGTLSLSRGQPPASASLRFLREAVFAPPLLVSLSQGRLLLVLDRLPDGREAGIRRVESGPATAGRGLAELRLGADPQPRLRWLVPPPVLATVFVADRPGTALLGLRLHAEGCVPGNQPRPLEDFGTLPEGEVAAPGRHCLVEVATASGLARILGPIVAFESLHGVAERDPGGGLRLLHFAEGGTPARPIAIQVIGGAGDSQTRPASIVAPGTFDPGWRPGERLVRIIAGGDRLGFAWEHEGRLRITQLPLAGAGRATPLADFAIATPHDRIGLAIGPDYALSDTGGSLRAHRGPDSREVRLPEGALPACGGDGGPGPRFSHVQYLGRGGGRDWFAMHLSTMGRGLIGLADPWTGPAAAPGAAASAEAAFSCLPQGLLMNPSPIMDAVPTRAALMGVGGALEVLELGGQSESLSLGPDDGDHPTMLTRRAEVAARPQSSFVLMREAAISPTLGLVLLTGGRGLDIWPMQNGAPVGQPALTALSRLPAWGQMALRGNRILLFEALWEAAANPRAMIVEVRGATMVPLAAGVLPIARSWPENAVLGLAEDGETILALSNGAPIAIRLPRLPPLPEIASTIRAREFPPGSYDAAMLSVAARLLRSGTHRAAPQAGQLTCATRTDRLMLWNAPRALAQAGEPCDGPAEAWTTAIFRPGMIDASPWPRAASLALAASLAGAPAGPSVLATLLRGEGEVDGSLSDALAPPDGAPMDALREGWPSADRRSLLTAAQDGSAAAMYALALRDARSPGDLQTIAASFARARQAEELALRAGLPELAQPAAELRARLGRLLPDAALLGAPPADGDVRARPPTALPVSDADRRRQDLAALADAGTAPPWAPLLRLHLALLRAEAGDPDRGATEIDDATRAFAGLAGARFLPTLTGLHRRLSGAGQQTAATALLAAGLAAAERGAGDRSSSLAVYRPALALLAEEQARGEALEITPGLGALETLFAWSSDLFDVGSLLASEDGRDVLARRMALLDAAQARRPQDAVATGAWIETALWRAEALEKAETPSRANLDEAARLRTAAAAALAALRAAGTVPDALVLVTARGLLRERFMALRSESLNETAAELAALRMRGSDAATAAVLADLELQLLGLAFQRSFDGTGAPEEEDAAAGQRLKVALQIGARIAALQRAMPGLDTRSERRPGPDLAAWAAGRVRLRQGAPTADACAMALPHPMDPDRAGPGRWLDTLDTAMIEAIQARCAPDGQPQSALALYTRSRLAAHLGARDERMRLLVEAASAGHRHAALFLADEALDGAGSSPLPGARALADALNAAFLREGYAAAAALLRPSLTTEEDRTAFGWLMREAALAGSSAAHRDLADAPATPRLAATHLLLAAERLEVSGEVQAAAVLRDDATRRFGPDAVAAAQDDARQWPPPPPEDAAPLLQALLTLFAATSR